MSLKIKKILILFILFLIPNIAFGNESLKSIGKFKDWETFAMIENENKVCFAQSIPILQAPKKTEREARLFVTFRSVDKIQDEVSVTAGYVFNDKNRVTAKSGKSVLIFSTIQENFAWFKENKTEKKLKKVM